jgi:hypothetical protein
MAAIEALASHDPLPKIRSSFKTGSNGSIVMSATGTVSI